MSKKIPKRKTPICSRYQHTKNGCPCLLYTSGNDNDAVDAIAADLLDTFADFCQKRTVDIRHQFIPGVSTFGRQVEWIPIRMATAFGKKQGAILSGNCSPTPGTDKEGATAVIRSYCKADLSRQASGAALDIPLTPSMVRGEEGLDALMSLIRGFVQLGGFFMQLDVEMCIRDRATATWIRRPLPGRVSRWKSGKAIR